jgi:A/G-specific adenine glycosylase
MTSSAAIPSFQTEVWDYFQQSGRHDLPWRLAGIDGEFDPYAIMVSELMLQQTQVQRVIPKYQEFLRRFPALQDLAAAELGAVLTAWSGLGYNRRAKFLWQAVQKIAQEYDGIFPQTSVELISLPGIGKNTAGAIQAYAFNQPVVFIETNIRSVYIHHFFTDQTDVTDADILQIVASTVDSEHPREWYWALMDYGSYLKKSVGNASKHSKTYTKQSAFHGSRRQIRGQVISLLTGSSLSFDKLTFQINDERLLAVLNELEAEGLIRRTGDSYQL